MLARTGSLFLILALVFPAYASNVSEFKVEPIVIEGNGDLTAENGVRGGTGTQEDPYRIERWLIHANRLLPGEAALTIRNVDRHVIISENQISALVPEDYGSAIGVIIQNSSNIAVHENTFGPAGLGVWVDKSYGIKITSNTFSDVHTNASPLGVSLTAVLITFSKQVRVSSNEVQGMYSGMNVQHSSQVLVERNHFHEIGRSAVMFIMQSNNVTVRQNEIDDVSTGISIHNSTAAVESNKISRTRSALISEKADISFVGNSVDAHELWFSRLTELRLNEISVHQLHFLESGAFKNNSFRVEEIRYHRSNTLNLEHNWWGSTHGPLNTYFAGDVDFDPWLEHAPV